MVECTGEIMRELVSIKAMVQVSGEIPQEVSSSIGNSLKVIDMFGNTHMVPIPGYGSLEVSRPIRNTTNPISISIIVDTR